MTKLHSHLKKVFIFVLSLTLILSSLNVYALDDTSNIIIEEDNINDEEEENNNITTSENIDNEKNSSMEEANNNVNSIDLYSNNEGISTHSIGNFDITLTPNTNGYGSVSLNWNSYNYTNKNFKVYKSSNGGRTYETIGIDYKSVREVKVLQVYPVYEAVNQLKVWMENNGYGKGIIKVDSVYIDTFNANPYGYLKDSSGNWKYDVIFFGTWDSNGGKDLSRASRDAVISYIKAGKGVILGHDTLVSSNESTINDWYFNTLATYFGMSFYNDNGQYSFGQTFYNGSNMVRIAKKGLLTNYPWELGDVGTTFHIPFTHNSGQYSSKATIWMDFGTTYYPGIAPERSDLRLPNAYNLKTNFYVSIYNNCAMIMTGDSSGKASDNEEKVLANLIFYMNQLLFNTYTTNDASAQDVAKPNNPSVSINNDNFNWSATDNGSTYYYYVESYDKNDTTSSGLLDKSTTKSLTITTGVKSYRYILDNEEKTKVTTSTGTSTTNTSLKIDSSKKYLHIIAIDGAGNVSDTTTYEIPQTISLTTSIIWNDNNNKNGFRPSKYTLKLMRNGSLFKQVELASSQTSYTFSNLTKYDSKGNAFKYTFEVDASDRYKITLDENGNTITENYQNSTFSVTIPKTISLNVNTGTCSYKVIVSGTFYYNDTLTVTPSSSFALKDKSSISTLQANVTQNVTTFTKDNLGTTSGSISLNKTKFAGIYNGTFNFNIKFTLKN